MSFVPMKELLEHAEKHRYGVPALKVFNYEGSLFAVKAAEEARMPLIIQYYPGLQSHAPLAHIRNMAMEMAEKAAVPMTVHLDHSWTYEIAVGGLGARYPSIMVDGSSLPFEENIALTQSVTRAAHAMGVGVEAELGHVGSGANLDDFQNTDHFTNPEQAEEFVARTECDSLAVAVGNAHGNYKKLPVLDFDRIEKLRDALKIPLVMHGGSGIPYDQMQRAVNCGMSKFNIATEYQSAFYRATQEIIAENERQDDYFGLLRKLERPCIDFVLGKIDMLNPNHFSL